MDAETIKAYDANAEAYKTTFAHAGSLFGAEHFLTGLPQGGAILDYGCGPGHAAAYFAENGYQVDAFDASSEMVALAARTAGVNAWQANFSDFHATEQYHGIWASFSLLHAPRDEFPSLLTAIKTALVAGGHLFLGMKLGEGSERDHLGRFYTYYTEDELRHALTQAGLQWVDAHHGSGKGLAGTESPWILIHAHA